METTPLQWLAIASVLLASSVVQGAVGFASGLFAIPLLLLVGLSLPQAITINIVASATQNLLGAHSLWGEIPWDRVAFPVLLRTLAIPLGLVGLYFLDAHVARDTVRQFVGGLLLLFIAGQWVWQSRQAEPDDEPPRTPWQWIAFLGAGFTLGLCGMGGPPMVLWVNAQNWPAARTRAFLFFVFLTGVIPQGLLLYFTFGGEVLAAGLLALTAVPAAVLGTWAGLWLGSLMARERLRIATMGVLVLLGLWSLVSPWVIAWLTPPAP